MPETASSAAVSDDAVADSGDRGWSSILTSAALALILGAMAAAMFASHRAGHWWGDDWALYIRQAQGLLDGDPGRVIDENLFTVETSRGAAFSPPLYPWGFPIILTPFVALVGADVDRLAVVPVLCAMVFAWSWFVLASRRIGQIPALVGVVAVTLTPLLLGWTELIQSEWPFLAVTGVVLVGIDRLAAQNSFIELQAPLWPLALVGIGAAAAFSVRREGLAMVAAIAAAQLAALIAVRWRPSRGEPVAPLLVRLLLPHVAALFMVGIGQLLLPSTLVPRYSGTSVLNVWRFRRDHLEHLAEVSGLKRSWQDAPEVFGNSTLGWIAVGIYLTAGIAGFVLAIVVYRRRDLHLVAYAIGALLIGGSFRSPINRYVCSVAPIVLLLGASAIYTAARMVPWRHTPTVVVTLALATIAAGNLVQANSRIDRAETVAEAGAVEWGPTHPLAIEMFAAVESLSETDDVIAAPKARAMTFETDRPAIQVDDYRPLPSGVRLGLVVVERDSDIAERLAVDREFREVWSNSRFVIYEPVATT